MLLNKDEVVIEKGVDIHRIVPRKWKEEFDYNGHAYAFYKKEDVVRYKRIVSLLGYRICRTISHLAMRQIPGRSLPSNLTHFEGPYVDMKFKTTETLISPSEEKRIDEFIKLMNSDKKARNMFTKETRNPLFFISINKLNNLKNTKYAKKAYRIFTYLLPYKKDLRNLYFNQLEKQGYSMVLDDGDIKRKITKSPIIIFDRQKSLSLESTNIIQRCFRMKGRNL